MSLLHTSAYTSVAQLCSAVSDCIGTKFNLDQHGALAKALYVELDLAVLQGRRQDEIDLRFAQADLNDWICAHLLTTVKAMEARYA